MIYLKNGRIRRRYWMVGLMLLIGAVVISSLLPLLGINLRVAWWMFFFVVILISVQGIELLLGSRRKEK